MRLHDRFMAVSCGEAEVEEVIVKATWGIAVLVAFVPFVGIFSGGLCLASP
jgi:hypothetical protein